MVKSSYYLMNGSRAMVRGCVWEPDKTFVNLFMMIFLDGFHKKAHNLCWLKKKITAAKLFELAAKKWGRFCILNRNVMNCDWICRESVSVLIKVFRYKFAELCSLFKVKDWLMRKVTSVHLVVYRKWQIYFYAFWIIMPSLISNPFCQDTRQNNDALRT